MKGTGVDRPVAVVYTYRHQKMLRDTMAGETTTLQELIVSSLAQTDALAKLLIEKGIITEQEFLAKLSAERATYQRMLNPTSASLYKGKRVEVEIHTDTYKIRRTLFLPLGVRAVIARDSLTF